MPMKLNSLLIAGLVTLAGPAIAANIPVTGKITTNTTWTKDNTYTLNGYVFVTNGATLTINPGTLVKGSLSSGTGAAALVITQGCKIHAVGTAQDPIIFTSELDQLNGNLSERDTGLWGGVVLLGKAVINSRADNVVVPAPITGEIEGFSVSSGDIPYITYGGSDDTDNSGEMSYVSIRHGGAVIGTGNEINGLTMGGVGSGTTIDHIEVFANKDDGIECFGGTVGIKYFVNAFGNDDGLDYDTGYRGNAQYIFNISTDIGTDLGDNGGEWDGATAPEATATPTGGAIVSNATFIGIGNAGRANNAIHMRDNGAQKFYNSVVTDYDSMLRIDADETAHVADGSLDISNNIFWSHVSANNTAAGMFAADSGLKPTTFFTDTAKNNQIVDPMLTGIGRTQGAKMLTPMPKTGSPAFTGPFKTLGSFFTPATFKGAFGTTNWAAGWTKLWSDGYFSATVDTTPVTGAAYQYDVPPIIPNSGSKTVNISTRGLVNGTDAFIAGFVVTGTQEQTILIRAIGPGLAAFGVQGTLADPILTLRKGQTVIKANDKHPADAAAISARVGAFALTAGSKDAVIVINVAPGAYTAEVSSGDGTSGSAIIEIYEVD